MPTLVQKTNPATGNLYWTYDYKPTLPTYNTFVYKPSGIAPIPQSPRSNKISLAISITTLCMTSLAILLAATTHQWGWMSLAIAGAVISLGNCGCIVGQDFELKTSILGFITAFLNFGGVVLIIYVI